jgi:outer membrane murein-binding lipoprotein Lpp
VRTLQAELTELQVESRQALERVTAWVERATRAEARLEGLANGVDERRS